MRATCVRRFRDLETGEMREEGTEFEVSAERLAEINGTEYGLLALAIEDAETPKGEPERPKRGRRTKAEEE